MKPRKPLRKKTKQSWPDNSEHEIEICVSTKNRNGSQYVSINGSQNCEPLRKLRFPYFSRAGRQISGEFEEAAKTGSPYQPRIVPLVLFSDIYFRPLAPTSLLILNSASRKKKNIFFWSKFPKKGLKTSCLTGALQFFLSN